jgi:late competence protein required for DNA uptake (superfamily II DNA/RNA helicase)
MKELIKYVKSVKLPHVNDVKRLYFNEEVAQVLKENNLTLIELIYRVKRDIPLNKILTCERCGKTIEFNKKRHSYSRFCGHKCANIVTVQSQNFKEKAMHLG